ncbi:NAD(P)H-binding protein [Xylella fastidiosa]|uniref:NAD(P)H-binding protein n=1 Tax=Xylella fastidiosa TaxID=2371 RepID=A0ABC8AE09_XYLFS|nr:NAD(P)H-binding protein [Xylella fastidiosa]ALR06577.1 NAD(P)H-binding protein [Xylella fastidiosa]
MAHSLTRRLLVAGATSPLGHRVVELLLRSSEVSVTATSRTPERLIDLAARGARVRKADYDDPGSLDAAYAGVERLLLVHSNLPGVPALRLRHHRFVVDAAVRAGVQHITCTSIIRADPGSPSGQVHLATEKLIEDCGIPFTILRLAPFTEWLFDRISLALRSGRWPSSAGMGRTAFVASDDAARVATATMLGQIPADQLLEVTGPVALAPAEVVAVCDGVFGASIDLVPVNQEALATALTDAGMAAPAIERAIAMDRNALEGRADVVRDVVERLTGRAPLDLGAVLIPHRLDLLLASKQT